MAGSDKVKLEVYSRDLGRVITVISSRDNANATKESFHSTVDRFVEVDGRVNDADDNKINMSFRRDTVGGVGIVEVNKDFGM